jgi:transposase
MVRYRLSLTRQRAQVAQRIQKVLEGANVKLSSVVTDLTGVSGRAMLEALISSTDSLDTIADLARGRLRMKRPKLVAALEGLVGPNQRLLLASHLRNLDFLAEEIERLNAEIEEQLRPFQELVERLDTIPGVGPRVAQAMLAEIGTDVSRFPTGSHLASWARVCPSNDESAGKRRSSHIGAGNPWLRGTLVEAAWAASHAKQTYLAGQYRRLAARRGTKRALIAVAHTILIIAYRIIRDGTTYEDLGSNYYDERDRQATLRRSLQRLERLGYKVTVESQGFQHEVFHIRCGSFGGDHDDALSDCEVRVANGRKFADSAICRAQTQVGTHLEPPWCTTELERIELALPLAAPWGWQPLRGCPGGSRRTSLDVPPFADSRRAYSVALNRSGANS